MAGVINDIEALAEFRAHLMRFNRDLAENFATIQGHWRELGEIWRDDMYRLFGEALDEVTLISIPASDEGIQRTLAASKVGRVLSRLKGADDALLLDGEEHAGSTQTYAMEL